MVEVWLPYGKTDIFVNIPDEIIDDIIKSPQEERKRISQEIITECLENPIGSEKLSDLYEPEMSVAIAVQESHSSILLSSLVQIIQKVLQDQGARAEDVRIIISGNIGYPLSKESLDTYNSSYRHHSFVDSSMAPLDGVGKDGSPLINKVFMESDLKIAIGVVEPNHLTGFTGAPYTVSPGLLDLKTNQHLYQDAFKRSYENVPSSETDFNPFNHCGLAGVDFTVNVQAERDEIVDLIAGDPKKAFRETVKRYVLKYKRPVKTPVDILIAGVGGSPFDSELSLLYQGVENALRVVEKQGQILLAAECEKWHNSKPLLNQLINLKEDFDALKKRKIEELLESPLRYLFMKAKEYADISLVSIMPHYYTKRALKFRAYRTVNHALQTALNRVNKEAKVLAVQDIYHTILTAE
ncbi:lactate racemase domain-containing protein [[Eubacterium] cellulosolvens]